MYVYGTASPAEDDSHSGVYMRRSDISHIASSGSMVGKPVLVEHDSGARVGRVVTAWVGDNGRLDCVFKLDEPGLDGILAREIVKRRKCPELSLGYSVAMSMDRSGMRTGGDAKDVLEVSIVRRGARPGCFIHDFSSGKASKD